MDDGTTTSQLRFTPQVTVDNDNELILGLIITAKTLTTTINELVLLCIKHTVYKLFFLLYFS
jgi:hypothetical protein